MTINVKVKPNSKKGDFVEEIDSSNLIIYIREIPEKGKANAALKIIISKHFHISSSQVELVKGAKSRAKIFKLSLK